MEECLRKDLSVFVDESGGTSMGRAETDDRWYVSAAVIVDSEKVGELSAAIDAISQDFNGGAPLKSSKIKLNHKRRFLLLDQLRMLDFRYVALVVDKSKLTDAQGLKFKGSYYKSINRHLYESLGSVTAGSVSVLVDTYGFEEFELSCVDYFNRRADLFNSKRASFAYCGDENNRLIQLADIIAGTLRYYYSLGDKEYCRCVRELLRAPKESRIDVFPPEYDNPQIGVAEEGTPRDKEIRRIVLTKAAEFIRQHNSDSDQIVRARIETLKQLMDAVALGAGPIHAEKIISVINRTLGKPIAKEQFGSEIIGKLRFAGIVIAGSRLGYKLAVSESDIADYLRLNKTVIEPMLAKMSVARSVFKAELDYDLLDKDGAECMRELLTTFDKFMADRALDVSDESEACSEGLNFL